MNNKKIYNSIYEKKCSVCGNLYLSDAYEQGECTHCKWYNNKDCEVFKDNVIFPNLISLNKARLSYREGKEFIPSLTDFLDGFSSYGEMKFFYKNNTYCLFRGDNNIGIKFDCSVHGVYYFTNKEDFIKNAKIDNEYVRDVWDKVENPSYM